jgi:hypothetical protein
MKKIFLIIALCSSFKVASQTVLKDKKQHLEIESVIQNGSNVYKTFFHDNYIILGNKALTLMFLEELLSVLHNEKSVDTYIGNVYARYEFIDKDNVTVHAKGSSFNLNRKQIEKIKSKIDK